MTRLAGFALAAALGTCAGCFTAALPESVVPAKAAPVSAELPPVSAGQFTGTNGQEVLQSLEAEITREEQKGLLNGLPR